MPEWTIAAAQYAACNRSVAENVAHHLHFIEAAAKLDCDVLLFPEMSLTGPGEARHLPVPPDVELLRPLSYAARRHAMTIITGIPVDVDGERTKGVAIFLPGASAPLTACQGQGTCLTPVGCQTGTFDGGAEGCEIDPQALLLATGICSEECEQLQSVQRLQRFAHRYAIAVLKSSYACGATSGGSALWDESGQLIVRADEGELLLTGRKHDGGWEGDIIPLHENISAIDECHSGA